MHSSSEVSPYTPPSGAAPKDIADTCTLLVSTAPVPVLQHQASSRISPCMAHLQSSAAQGPPGQLKGHDERFRGCASKSGQCASLVPDGCNQLSRPDGYDLEVQAVPSNSLYEPEYDRDWPQGVCAVLRDELRCKQSMAIDASLVAALERLLFPEGGRGRTCLASQLHQLASALELEEANEDTEPQGASGGSVCAPPGCSAAPGSGGGEGPADCNAAGTLEHQPEQPAAQELLPPCSAPATCSAADKPEGAVPNQQTPSTRPAVAE